MIGRVLCALGLHYWEYRDESGPDLAALATKVTTYARCRRHCREAGDWTLVNVERLHDRRPW